MSLLKEISANVLATNTIVLTTAAAVTTTISQELTPTTVITLPSSDSDLANLLRINGVFTNTIPITQPVSISLSNAQNAVVGTELVLFIRFSYESPADPSAITLSPDFYWTACDRLTDNNIVVLSGINYFVMRFLYNGTVFVNTYDLA